MSQTVYLLRHGRTEANRRRLYCGSTDLPLSPEGTAELRRLAERGGYPPIAGLRVITSGLRRTAETLFAIYGPVPFETEPGFREMDFGDFEGKSYEMLRDDPAYQAWIAGDNEKNRCPNGESGADMTRRVLAAWERVVRDGRDALLVIHGGSIAAILQSLEPERGESRYRLQPENGHGWRLTLQNGVLLQKTPFPEE